MYKRVAFAGQILKEDVPESVHLLLMWVGEICFFSLNVLQSWVLINHYSPTLFFSFSFSGREAGKITLAVMSIICSESDCGSFFVREDRSISKKRQLSHVFWSFIIFKIDLTLSYSLCSLNFLCSNLRRCRGMQYEDIRF